uniref:Protein max n=1 Tax=Cyanistes caeruleus TaxID=156563 RepID=A0A8C0U429_CYACU
MFGEQHKGLTEGMAGGLVFGWLRGAGEEVTMFQGESYPFSPGPRAAPAAGSWGNRKHWEPPPSHALAAQPEASQPRSRPGGSAELLQKEFWGCRWWPPPSATPVPPSQADKRAHHNALERKRRDHIKDSFHSLRDSVPSLQGEKASRAQILDKATEYIQYMRRKNHTHQQDIDDLKRQNALLEQQGGS